jgi:hypothetical protein
LLLKALACVRSDVRGAARFSGAPCIWSFLGNLSFTAFSMLGVFGGFILIK